MDSILDIARLFDRVKITGMEGMAEKPAVGRLRK